MLKVPPPGFWNGLDWRALVNNLSPQMAKLREYHFFWKRKNNLEGEKIVGIFSLFHQLGPLGRVSHSVAMSVCQSVCGSVCVIAPSQNILFRRLKKVVDKRVYFRIGASLWIRQESQGLPYAGFFLIIWYIYSFFDFWLFLLIFLFLLNLSILSPFLELKKKFL